MKTLDLTTLKTITVDIDRIKPYPTNPREHPAEQIKSLATSIRRYGFNNPVLINPDLTLIAGHGRLMAAREAGLTSVLAIVMSHLSEAEQRAYRIADNAIALKGIWSPENLATEVDFLFNADFDFDFSAADVGLEVGELDYLIHGKPGSKAQETAAPPEPDRGCVPVSRLGDIWRIGRHTIANNDSTLETSFQSLMGLERAALAFSDMPYNVPVNGHVSGLGKIQHREFVMGSGEMDRAQFQAFIRASLTNQARFSRHGALNLHWADWRMAGDMIAIGEDIYDSFVNMCVWVKPQGGMGSMWRSRHELVLAFRVKGGKHINNVQLGKMGRNRSNVWEYPSPGGFGSERNKLHMHPTCKNEDLLADAIMDVTNQNDIVLDAFIGSGSTALAAHKVGRICRGLELDPHYVDLAASRLSEATGCAAVRQDGVSFDDARDQRVEESGK